MRYASIDIGTNTILLLVADHTPKGLVVLHDEQTIVRLGQDVSRSRRFADEAMVRAMDCLNRYADTCRQLGVDPSQVAAVATSASRDAENQESFYARVSQKTGFNVRIISGEEEARYSFLGGLLPGQEPLKTAVIDIGGGSTEFVLALAQSRGEPQIRAHSVDMGCVRATELYLAKDAITLAQCDQLEAQLKAHWSQVPTHLVGPLKQRQWNAVAGTATTLAAVALGLKDFDVEKINGYIFDRCALADVYESLAAMSLAQRSSIAVIGSGRADVIVAGAAILLTAMEFFDQPSVTVSTQGLRYGVLKSGAADAALGYNFKL
jgi:exopolyphosphatase/guanosine-5'-triphosphate,3'-diphosphate pyrophosphatase